MIQFIQLLNHSDRALSEHLQQCAEKGWFLRSNHGNWFFFQRRAYHGERLTVITFHNDAPDRRMRDVVRDYTEFMQDKGWKLISRGSPEDIFDSKRHLFFETSDSSAEVPKYDSVFADKDAQKREARSARRCLLMLLLLFTFGAFFMTHDFDIFISSAHLLSCGGIATLALLLSLFFCLRGAIERHSASKHQYSFSQDHAVFLCICAMLLIVAAFVSDDLLIPANGDSVQIADETFTLYHDDLPLTLEDIGEKPDAPLRSSRLIQRNSFLAHYQHGSDQNFSALLSPNESKSLSYTCYQSSSKWILDTIVSQKMPKNAHSDPALADQWDAEAAYSGTANGALIVFQENVLLISSSAPLDDTLSTLICEKLAIQSAY